MELFSQLMNGLLETSINFSKITTMLSVETSRMTSQTTLIASPRRPDGTCKCRRRVTCAMDDAWRESSQHKMSQETVAGRFPSLLPSRKRVAVAGWNKEA
ncbi:hypothetical protein EVAR_9719_1 [Eumeta japonica]|uniref:Uncharacterized protein n=1 Tax=Eumeta variegata TaxID=151549 RepID=A0A4C1U6S3_EUMVA|nr:hypothetical protein EVAR_9719_1 [Eumeta japonica]